MIGYMVDETIVGFSGSIEKTSSMQCFGEDRERVLDATGKPAGPSQRPADLRQRRFMKFRTARC